jgi:hypothetical protein
MAQRKYAVADHPRERQPMNCFLMLIDVANGVLYRNQFLGVFIRNIDVEFFFHGHDQLDQIQGIGAKIVHERGFGNHFFKIDAQFIGNYLFDFVFYGHGNTPFGWVAGTRARRPVIVGPL